MEKSSQFLLEESKCRELNLGPTQSSSIKQVAISIVFNIPASTAAIPGCPTTEGKI
jgi:hypothetical protein